MREKKKISLLLRTKPVLNRRNTYKLLLIGTIIILLIIITFLLFDKYIKIIRDSSRKDLMKQIKVVVEQVYEDNDRYPSAILFSENEALVCEDIDCLQYQSVKIGRYAKAINGSNTKTSTTQTKYDYELSKDGYKLGYCDEEGKVQNYGISQESVILMCN